MEQLGAHEVVQQAFAPCSNPVVDRAENLHRKVAIFKGTDNLSRLRGPSVHKARQEGVVYSVSSTCTGVLTEQILRDYGVLLSVYASILPVADEEAHIVQKGSPLLQT
jgi:hypothetical protein